MSVQYPDEGRGIFIPIMGHGIENGYPDVKVRVRARRSSTGSRACVVYILKLGFSFLSSKI